MNQQLSFRRTTLITCGLLAFLPGLALAKYYDSVVFGWAVIAAMLCAVTVSKHSLISLVSVVLLGLTFGLWRGGQYLGYIDPYKTLTGKQVTYSAEVLSDAVYGYKGQLSFDVGRIKLEKPYKANLPGKVTVSGRGEQAVYRGDKLLVSGKLMPTRGSRQARMSFANYSTTFRDKSVAENTRRSFVAGVETAVPEPMSSFGLGLLIGYRTTLPEITAEYLAITGLTHIIAVSGYNLTIIIRTTRRLLKGWSKYQQTVVCAVLILAFLLVTDFSASIVRAAIVSGLSLGAWYYGRRFKPMVILALAAAITSAFNPIYVWSDVGWYLSFLAFFGILVIAPLFTKVIYGNKAKRSFLMLLAIETTAAQIMTAPIILFIFGRASLIGIVSNIIIGPLVPFAMLFTLVAGLAGMFVPVLSGWLALPARILLKVMLDVIGVFARLPHAAVQRTITAAQMVAMYVIIGIGTLTAKKSVNNKYGTIQGEDLLI